MYVGKNGKSKIVNDMDELLNYAGCDGMLGIIESSEPGVIFYMEGIYILKYARKNNLLPNP